MAKVIFTFFLLILTLGRVVATPPNTGPVPDHCIKLEFSNKAVKGVEPSSWELIVGDYDVSVSDGVTLIVLTDFVLKDDKEIIGFSWEVKGSNVESFTVKHGRTIQTYNNEFITLDRKGVSNAVFCLSPIEDEPEVEEPPIDEEPPVDEEPEVEEPPIDEEPEIEEPPVEEPEVDEPEVDEPPVEEPEEENPVDEPEVEEPEEEVDTPVEPIHEDDDEMLPETSDSASAGLTSALLAIGVFLTLKHKNQD